MKTEDIFIVAAQRTPIGNMLGGLSSLSAPKLNAYAHRAALTAAKLDPEHIDEVISGCVLSAGIGQAPARQSAIEAGIPEHVGATTINKMCGSGMKAIMLGHDLIRAGSAGIVLASGMESMSNAPYLLSKARAGYRLGHSEIKDHMFLDGLEDAYDKGRLMGIFAEQTAQQYQLTREAQDEFATLSLKRALSAASEGAFNQEIVPITLKTKQGETTIRQDECPDPAKIQKIPQLRPAFSPDGTVTAANSSSISDGAASVIVMSGQQAAQQGITPLARIVAHATHAQAPALFTTAPVFAIQKVLKLTGWSRESIDLFEINEAFAVVTMAALRDLELDINRVNIHGGACALGHPIGASGTRIVVTLIHALKRHQKKRGIAALCIGGGEATALAIEIC